jgi:hypothetical protein
MSDQLLLRRDILDEVYKRRRRITECPHCASLRQEIEDLFAVMPPEPFWIERANALQLFAELVREADKKQ